MSERNVRRKLDLYTPPEIIPTPADVIAIDVTYFGRSWGILTIINVHNGRPLYYEVTNGYETIIIQQTAFVPRAKLLYLFTSKKSPSIFLIS